jgi:predicted GNAT family acetyltransferase
MPLLAGDEARHNLILGLAATLRDQPEAYPEHAEWIVRDGSGVVGAALRTPPYNLVLARPRATGVLELLVEQLDADLPGVTGALPEVEDFARLWSARTGGQPTTRGQGIYALTAVRPAPAPSGRMRAATHADVPLLTDWWCAFVVEALGDAAPERDRVAVTLERRLTALGTGLAVWEHDGSVSFAGYGGETPNGIRIGPVYTPPGRRGRGYATALVAALSAELLAAGRRFCFLYTDLANPTSNRIYQRIGYERVCDSAEIRFR